MESFKSAGDRMDLERLWEAEEGSEFSSLCARFPVLEVVGGRL